MAAVRARMKGVTSWEGDAGMLVGTPAGAIRRITRSKGVKIIRGTEARGPVVPEAVVRDMLGGCGVDRRRRATMGRGRGDVWEAAALRRLSAIAPGCLRMTEKLQVATPGEERRSELGERVCQIHEEVLQSSLGAAEEPRQGKTTAQLVPVKWSRASNTAFKVGSQVDLSLLSQD